MEKLHTNFPKNFIDVKKKTMGQMTINKFTKYERNIYRNTLFGWTYFLECYIGQNLHKPSCLNLNIVWCSS